MQIIPAIDIIDGKCVRLTEGDYAQKTIYNENPLEVAKAFEAAGIQRLHLVDLDGAKAGAVKNWKVLETIALNTKLVIDFGGGIKTDEDVALVFERGATLATIGSIAVSNPALFLSWVDMYGADRFFLGADVKDNCIAVNGWMQTSSTNIETFIGDYLSKGITHIFCTDVSKDGRLEGPSTILYQSLIQAFPNLQLVASGGVSSLQDLEALDQIGCSGAIVGKAIYENRISLESLQQFNS
ncbi:MAG: 1-(5-phosphoribosyl)-5-[(5-phosphoribosylamino)methylideneamino]imidazole-4-carboxamide isomerase [Bacteroidetes bacterium]|nr:1-(5-phosphoribosyl)-5-[(5-phosphoribosylamino)methylideneamino]imidazole-4-carboxamide isomerase [Bacteroidota bacterium]